jgi:glycerophosphoryl diester phosphodiesterase
MLLPSERGQEMISLLLFVVLNAGETAGAMGKPFFEKPLLLAAHRGGAQLWPENTIEGYRKAVETWPDILIEGDVRLTADGRVVLLHDERVDRTTDGTGEVSRMTLEQVKRLDAGYRFTSDGGNSFPYRGNGIRIPTFEDALKALPDSRFLIELKEEPEIAAAVIGVIRAAGAVDRVAVASFSPALMAQARREEPRLVSCYDFLQGMTMLAQLRGPNWREYKPAADMLAIGDDLIEKYQLKPGELRAMREKGVAVLVHTVNDPDSMKKFLECGVTSILTDRPNVLAELISARK